MAGSGLDGTGIWLGVGRFLASAALLALPTTLMGATLPLLSRFTTQRLESMGRDLGRLYALNTLGAALGAALTGFLLVPSLGVQTTLWAAAGANLLIGMLAFALPDAPSASASADEPSAELRTSARLRQDFGKLSRVAQSSRRSLRRAVATWPRPGRWD